MPTPGMLLKTRAGGAALQIDGAQSQPLFQSIGRAPGLGAPGLGVDGAAAQWRRVAVDEDSPAALWDRCHQLMRQGLGVDGGVEAAEPDLPQQWTWATPHALALSATLACGAPQPPSPDYPAVKDVRDWFRDRDHSNFGAPDPTAGQGVRIAHLDTGYSDHLTVPPHLDKARQRNFVDADRPDDATDTAGGPFTQHGHGTATLALLGSAAYGGAPGAEIIPMRVADSVVLFSNSSIAQALDEVHRLTVQAGAPIDVVSMSMGGLASQAWADAVNALYDAGVFMATAAGNNYANLPTRFIVFPARFNRVTAACGVMSDGRPYANLAANLMAGDYGPPAKMATAMAAATPNLPWARIGCPGTVDLTGSGTSSATPQVAAAAALYIGRNRAALAALPEPWMRVEAVRKALFGGARPDPAHQAQLGWGRLDVQAALAQATAAPGALTRQPPDTADWGLIRVLSGFGIAPGAAASPADRMLEVEALQLSQRLRAEDLVDWSVPPDQWSPAQRRQLAQALADQPEASQTLKSALGFAGPATSSGGPPGGGPTDPSTPRDPVAAQQLAHALAPTPPTPPCRRLRAYAYDPASSNDIDRYGLNEAALDVRWEPDLAAGPVGEYLEVVDVDPASACAYAPVDLNDPRLIATDGLAASETDPQFHQQMVYAVAMKTIECFELALGRVALWAPPQRGPDQPASVLDTFVRRLRIYPHAMREENAFYSPQHSALLFGYFNARDRDTGTVLPGGVVFSCLSHDIVAHETTHALLDGLHRYYQHGTGADALAFHEAFADIVALFQHFTVPEALREEIRKMQGRIERESLLGELAVQFGEATGRRSALRSYIGEYDPKTRAWIPHEPKVTDYASSTEAHTRGAVLVSAIFEAFLTVYRLRSADLVRLATGGTGVLPEGDEPADLVSRLTMEATAVAGALLQMCIRALDYCPPVDITFGDYLRALITADQDVSSDTHREYRIALIAAFRARGIYPEGVRQLSTASVAWDPPPIDLPALAEVLLNLDKTIGEHWTLYTDREQVWSNSAKAAKALWHALMDRRFPDRELEALGLVRVRNHVQPLALDQTPGELHAFEVHSVRPARRFDARGQARTNLVVEITQRWSAPPASARPEQRLRGGCTILFEIETRTVRYLIRKKATAPNRLDAQTAFQVEEGLSTLRGAYYSPGENPEGEPFAALHNAF